MTENELVERIGKLCTSYGLLWCHFVGVYRGRRALHGRYGYPDLTIVGPRGILFRECKAGSALRLGQKEWRDALRASGQDWAVWYPVDLSSGRIERELAAVAARA